MNMLMCIIGTSACAVWGVFELCVCVYGS